MPTRVTSRAVTAKTNALIKKKRSEGDRDVAAALAAYRSLSMDDRRHLIHEIILTRSEELRLAYPQVDSIGSGFRQTERRRGKRTEVVQTSEPVIVFFVSRKWKKEPTSAAARKKLLPDVIKTFATDPESGERVLCAVPTDVQPTGRSAKPQRPVMLKVKPNTGNSHRGTASCAVTVKPPGGAPKIHAVSCYHVLWPHLRIEDPTAEVTLREGGQPVGSPDPRLAGAIRPGDSGRASHDAAFMPVADANLPALRSALHGLKAFMTIPATQFMPLFALVLTHQNGVVKVGFPQQRAPCDRIGYKVGGFKPPYHQHLFEWTIRSGKTQAGDSGSPVVTTDGKMLLGIHLAGVPGVSYMLPIYDILNPLNLDNANPGSLIKLKRV